MAVYILAPTGDPKTQWTEVPAGASWSILNEPIVQPTTPDTSTGYIESSTNNQINNNDITTFDLSGDTMTSVVLWAYIDVLVDQAVSVLLNNATGLTLVGSGTFTGPQSGWVPITYTGTMSQAVLDAVSIQTTMGEPASPGQAGTSKVYATYVEVTTTGVNTYGTPFDNYGAPSSTYGNLGTSAQFFTLGVATETDTAQPIVRAYNLGVAVEDDQALPVNREIATVSNDTGWSWFNDPHIVLQNEGGKRWLHTGGITGPAGDVCVDSYDLDAETITRSVLHAALQLDDHDPASLLVMPDGTLLATYSKHGTTPIYFRRTTDPDDPTSWGTETSTAPDVGGTAVTYPKPVRFASNGRIYVFFRAGGNSQAFIYSDNDGSTWSAGVNFLVGDGSHRPYLNVGYDVVGDRLDIIYTDGHPRDIQNNQYHVTFDGASNVRRSNGTLIRNVISTGTVAVAEGTMLYDSDGTIGRSWGWNVCRDPADNTKIYAVFARFHGDSQFDHRYCYAEWNGSAWSVNQDILGETAGWAIFGTAGFSAQYLAGISEGNYSGGIHLSKADPRSVYLSRLARRGYAGEVVSDIPNVFLHMDEMSGTTALDTVLGWDGTYVNTPTLGVAGALATGTAVQFVAANSEEMTVPLPALSTNGTIEFWFKWMAGTPLVRDDTSAAGWVIGVDVFGAFSVRLDGHTLPTSRSIASLQDNAWHHIVVAKAGTAANVYIDGQNVMSGTGFGSNAATMPWHVARNGTAATYADVTIDGFSISPSTLSAARARAHYEARLITDEWRIEKWTRTGSGLNFDGYTIEGGAGVKRLRPVGPENPQVIGADAPETVWMVGTYDQYNDTLYDTDAHALIPIQQPAPAGVTLGLATETDTALPLSVQKVKTLTLATETDTAIAQSLTWVRTLALASETDTAQAVTLSKRATLTLASETSTALALSLTRLITLPVATEADSAQALTAFKSKALTFAGETDAALPLSLTWVKTLGIATTIESALAVAKTKVAALTLAAEADAALALSTGQGTAFSLTVAVETDSAQALTAHKPKTLSASTEADTAQALTAQKTKSLGLASDTSTALPLAYLKVATLTPAIESDQAIALSKAGVQTITLTPAAETDTALALPVSRIRTLVATLETDTAQALAKQKATSLSQAVESDTARPLSVTQLRTLILAAETNTALALSTQGGIEPLTGRLESTTSITFIEGAPFLNAALEGDLNLTTIE